MKRFYIVSGFLLISSIVFGQTLDDAVRFSRVSATGSARSTAMGGAFGALGGDISTLGSNPAGIGVFRKSEVTFTPSLNFTSIQSGRGAIEKSSFQIGQLGAVFSFYSPNFDWKGINFGINYTNLNNFNQKLEQLVENSPSSFTNVWAYNSYGIAPENLPDMGSALAYDTKLIYLSDDEETYNYYSVLEMLDNETGNIVTLPVNQHKITKEDGYQGEYAFSFGTNYKDKLYLGITLGIQSLYYKMKSNYLEAPEADSPSGLDYFTYDEHIKINGVGTNLKFGMIYRPIPQVRIGAAIHTPTWYNLSYDYEAYMDALYLGIDPAIGRDEDAYSFTGATSFDYNMRTPWRAILSLATVIRQQAILSADYEYVNYKNARYSDNSDNYDYYYENMDIEDLLRATHNFRIGAEYRFNSVFSLRAGYGFQASPYKHDTDYYKIQSLSGGFGLNFGVFYCDAAYVHKYSKGTTVFYSGYNPFADAYFTAAPIMNKYNTNEARVTLGVRF